MLLISIIQDIQEAQSSVDVDNFFDINELEDGVAIQSLIFDPAVFKTAVEVAEWLQGKWFSNDEVEVGEGGNFVSRQIDLSQFSISTPLKTVEVRRGIKAVVGSLLIDMPMGSYLSLGNEKSVKLDGKEKVNTVIEVARIVEGVHPIYGAISITKEKLLSFKNNFDKKVFGKDICFDFDHKEENAAGWPKSLFLSENGERLFAVVDWTPKGFDALSNREYRYFSPQFKNNYVSPTTGMEFGPTLTGGGITNKPFLEMTPISLNSKGGIVDIKELEAKLTAKDADIVSLNSKITAIEARNSVLETENKTLKVEKESAAKNSEFEAMLTAGTACEAQREFYLKGDLAGYAKAAVKLNVKETGSVKGSEDSEYQLSDAEKKVCKNLKLTEDEYMSANKLGKYAVKN